MLCLFTKETELYYYQNIVFLLIKRYFLTKYIEEQMLFGYSRDKLVVYITS